MSVAIKSFQGPYCLVVSNGVLQNSSDVFALLDPDAGGAGTFTVPLSADGTGSPTHWAAYTQLEANTHNALTTMTVAQFKAYVDQVAADRGRQPVGSVTAFKNNVQISEERSNPWEFIASLGLKVIEGYGAEAVSAPQPLKERK